jgi:hypothetical protein
MKMAWRLISLMLILLLALTSLLPKQARADEAIIDCSLINLIATPEWYHGKKVRVIGYAVTEFEQYVLYFSETDADRLIARNGVWLSSDEKAPERLLRKGIGNMLSWLGSLI